MSTGIGTVGGAGATPAPFDNSLNLATTKYVDGEFSTNVGVVGFKDDFLFATLAYNGNGTTPNIRIGGTASGTVGTPQMLSGQNIWGVAFIVAAATLAIPASTFINPGQLQFTTGAVSGNGSGIYSSAAGASSATCFGALGSNAGWEAHFIFSLGAATNIAVRVGFSDTPTQDAPTNGIYVEYDTANTGNTDTKFTLVARSAAASSYAASAVTPDTNFHHIRIFSTTAGTIQMTVDGGATVSLNTNVPTASLAAYFQILTRTTAAATGTIDFFSYIAATGRT